MATGPGSYSSAGGGATTADTSTIPNLDPSLETAQVPHATASTSGGGSSYSTLLTAIAQHYNLKVGNGQNLEDAVLARLSQEADQPHNQAPKASDFGAVNPLPLGGFGHSSETGPQALEGAANHFIRGITPGEPGATPNSGRSNPGGSPGREGSTPHPGQRPPPGPSTERTRNNGNSVLKHDDQTGTWVWVSQKNGEWVPDHNQRDNKPPASAQRQSQSGQTAAPADADAGTAAEGQGNTKAVADIARKLNLGEGADLNAIANHLGINTQGQSALTAAAQKGDNGQTVYSRFVKGLSDPKTKQTWTEALEKANLLDASQNNGNPDNAHIAAAFQQAMQKSIQTKTDIGTTVTNLGNAPQMGPDGKPIQQTSSELEAFVQGMGDKFGIHLSADQVTTIANQYKGDTPTNGVQGIADEVKNSVVQYYNPTDPLNPPGAANDMYLKIQTEAQKYGIPFSPQDALNWVKLGIRNSAGDSYSIAQASTDVAAMAAQHYQQLAQGMYPSLAGQIGAGMDVASLIAPYNTITAQYTGKDPASLSNPGVDPTSPNYKFLQGAADPKTGAPTMMTMDAWKKTLMQDPQYGFQNTTGGKNMASQFSSALLNEFGVINTGNQSTPFSGYTGQPGGANT